jgi:hypothetical protein
MLASKRAPKSALDADLVLPPPRQTVFAQLNVRVDPTIDARLKRFCLMTQAKQAHIVGAAIDSYLRSKGY